MTTSPLAFDAASNAASSSAMIEIRPVASAKERTAFIRTPYAIYQNDPAFVPPLEFEVAARLNPKSNPILAQATHQLWIAYRDGRPKGRISAILNPLHLDRHKDDTGHFGFLDAVDDAEIFAALMKTAEDWLRDRGAKHIAGPFDFSVNEVCGVLVDGFDTPPYVMMGHGRRYYPARLEALGYEKAQDMHALSYRNEKDFIPEKRIDFVNKVLASKKVEIRNLNFKTYKDDIKIITEVFNDAWHENWGFIPFTDEQADHMAGELRPIITKENVVLCFSKGEPVAMGLVLPNINEAIADFNGKLLPFNWAKLLWRLKVKGLKSARMPLMGVVKKLQGKPLGAALAYKIIDMVNSANIEKGVERSELSWILETNPAMLNMLTDMGGEIYKTYRIYKKPLYSYDRRPFFPGRENNDARSQ